MNSFKKALKSAKTASKHAFMNIGFKRGDIGDSYMAERHEEGKSNYVKKLSTKKGKLPKSNL